MKSVKRIGLVGAATAAVVALFGVPAYAGTYHAVHVVEPGHSIQKAVDAAHPGDTIQLRGGTYNGGVVITKNNLTIRGSGSVLKPIGTNGCAKAGGEQSGICVLGAPGHLVKGVTIEKLTVQGFAGFGVVGFFTDQLTVTGVSAKNNKEYGITEFESTRGAFIGNTVTGSTLEAGLYVGDVADAEGTVVKNNFASGNALGLLVRHAHNVKVTGNIFVGNCTGIALVDDGQPGGQGDTWVSENVIDRNNTNCPPAGDVPPLQGTGIVILGGVHNVIQANVVVGNRGNQPFSGGITLFRGVPVPPATVGNAARNNVIKFNVVRDNSPADLINQSGSSTNTFRDNSCGTSQPKGLCD